MLRMAPPCVACIAVLLLAGVPARAQEPASALAEARALAGAGNHGRALAALGDLIPSLSRREQRRPLAEAELLRSASLRAIAQAAAARQAAERALEIGRALDDPGLQARALVQMARLQADHGDVAPAGELLKQASPLAERSGDPQILIAAGEALAANARARGQAAEAADHYARVIAAADRAGDLSYSIRARAGRSSALLGLGRLDEALADADRAYALAEAAPANLRANATFALGQVHANLWNLERAADLWDQAVALYREGGLQIGVALSLRQSMDTRFAMRDFDRAASDGAAALALYGRTGSQGSLADTLARLALIETRRGRPDDAAAYAARASAAAADVPTSRLIYIENDLGLVELYAGRPRAAADRFKRVRDLARAQDDAEYEWRGQYGLGRAALAMGHAPDAQAHLELAAAGLDRLRRALPSPAQRATFMSQRSMVHEALVEALVARARAPDDWFARQAFAVAEAARARALADYLTEALSRSANPEVRAVQAREAEFSRRIAAIQADLIKAGDGAARARLGETLADAEREYESLMAELRRGNPRLAALAPPPAVTAAELAARLGPGEALVEYLVAESFTWVWAFRAGRMVSYRGPARAGLEALVQRVRAAASGGDVRGLRDAGAEASRRLLAPAEPLLQDATRLIVVADGPLHRLPFAALPAPDGRPLIERHAVSLAPSATIVAHLRRKESTAPRMLLAFAAPGIEDTTSAAAWRGYTGWRDLGPLPNADAEAREAARLVGGASDVRAPAVEDDVKRQEVGEYRVLHFAAHAVVDERVPRRSAIVLGASEGEDGLLQANEIAHLPLNADLVVLAACRTQMGRAVRGEGLLNLSRAFLQAGARSVIASLWDVNDADTRALMRALYGHLDSGAPPDEALRLAQLDLMRVPGPSSMPATWGAFVVSGDASRPFAGPGLLTRSAAAAAAVTLAAVFVALAAARGVGLSRRSPESGRPTGECR